MSNIDENENSSEVNTFLDQIFRIHFYYWQELGTLQYQKTETMEALIIVLVLFVLAILSPVLFPNKKVSKHEKDWMD